MKVASVKINIRTSKYPFDGDNNIFKSAISQLRKEGIEILKNRKKCHYYIPGQTIGY